MKRVLLAFVLAACGNDGTIEPTMPDAGGEPDPLEVKTTPQAGSLDDLHERIIAKRCSGQPGLCHNGQFEPNLSTPGLTYAYVVNRPSIEKPSLLRVKPGSAAQSLFIDKIRNRDVATQMPLGAEPLEEAEIAELEAWINGGALRAPGAAAAPVLNNPPKRPQVGIFNTSGTRLDGTGPVVAAAGTTLVLRHTVHDFETTDASIPFAAVIVSIEDGRNVVLNPGQQDPHVGQTAFDAAGPAAQGDVFNYRRSWTIPSTLTVRTEAGVESQVPASGQRLRVLAVYIDGAPAAGGIIALDASTSTIEVP